MEMGILLDTYLFLSGSTVIVHNGIVYFFSSKAHYKLRYKGSIIHNFVLLYLNLQLRLRLLKAIVSV